MAVNFTKVYLLLTRRFTLKSFRRFSTRANAECHEEQSQPHTPVMLKEVIKHLNLREGDLFLDMTFGAGGHSSALLKSTPDLTVLALDRDPTAQEYAKELEEQYPGRVIPLEGKFSDLPLLLASCEISENSIDGVLFDLGCSSMQFDRAERGFSVNKTGPLDMRMDSSRLPGQLTAADVLMFIEENDLAKILKIYGGEKKAVKIARAIVEARAKFKPLKTTTELADLIDTVLEGDMRTDKLKRKTSVATKVFQALRIFINNEMNELNYGILLAHRYLKSGGRAVALTFHSLEDTIVKRHFQNVEVDNCVKPLPLMYVNPRKSFHQEEMKKFRKELWEVVNKKVIVPSEKEVEMNPRSRSAKLRAARKKECSLAIPTCREDQIGQSN